MNLVFGVLQVGGLFLHAVVLFLLLRGYFWKHAGLFAYNLSILALSLFDQVLFRRVERQTTLYSRVYWTSEIVWDILFFVLVAVLIQKAVAERPEQKFVRKLFLFVVAAMIVLPFVIFPGRKLFATPWFSATSQLLNFGAAILNLVLWGILIASRNRDTQLMLVCFGLGVNVAGAALGWGVRLLARGTSMAAGVGNAADLFAGITYMLGLLIWCYAFWPVPKPALNLPERDPQFP